MAKKGNVFSESHYEYKAVYLDWDQDQDCWTATIRKTGKTYRACGARKKNKTPCGSHCTAKINRCRLHGGATPVGDKHPAYRHGGYSKYARVVSETLGEDLRQITQNRNQMLEGYDEISLLLARLMQLLRQLDTHEAGYWWVSAQKAYDKFVTQMGKPAVTESEKARRAYEMDTALNELGESLKGGNSDMQAWQDVYKAITLINATREKEVKRLQAQQETFSREQVLLMFHGIGIAIRETIKDDGARQKLVNMVKGVFPDDQIISVVK